MVRSTNTKLGCLIRTHCEEVGAKRPELTKWSREASTPKPATSNRSGTGGTSSTREPQRRQTMEIPPRNTPPRGEKFPRQSTKPTPRPKKGLATTQKSLGSVAAIPVTEPPKQHRRIFMIGSERIRRVASAARKSVPNPQFSKSPYAYIIEDNMDENIKPTSATLDMWRDWLISKKVTKGDNSGRPNQPNMGGTWLQ